MISRISFAVALTAMALTLHVPALAQAPAAATGPQWKSQAEYDLYTSATKDTNPTTRIAKLEEWKQKFPDSAFAAGREDMLMAAYQQAGDWQKAFDQAMSILNKTPDSYQALVVIVQAMNPPGKPQLKSPTPADLDNAQKELEYLKDNFSDVFATSKKPQQLTAAQWDQLQKSIKAAVIPTLIGTAQLHGDPQAVSDSLTALLKKDDTQSQVSYALGNADLALAKAKSNPEGQKTALYQFARAAAYDGPNSIDAANRQKILKFLTDSYDKYHGGNDGLDMLLATAKAHAFPPDNYSILSSTDVAEQKAKEAAEFATHNPMLALWDNIKMALTADGGDAYWDMSVKDAALPGGANGVMKFTGKIVSMAPETRPKQITLAIAMPGVADVTLNLDAPLPGKMEPGEQISFSGVAKSYTKAPFMVTFDVMKADIDGWTGKNAPVRRGGAKKKK